jgi:exodeoxyribonuclease VII large subunit
VRAATPTDAAKRVVPDVAAERDLVADLRERAAQALRAWVQREFRSLEQLRSRPCLDRPLDMLSARHEEVERMITTARRDVERLVSREETTISHLRRSLTALGPAATLARGYAVVLKGDHVVRTVDEAPTGTELRIRLQDGSIRSIVTEPTDDTVES